MHRPSRTRSSSASTLGPAAALMGSVLSVQIGASLAKGLFHTVGPQGTTSLRLAFGALILAVAFRPWRSPPPWRAWPALVGYGVAMGVMNLFFYLALSRIALGVAVALEFVGPLSLALLGSRRPLDFVWLACAAAGLLLLSPLRLGAAPLDPLGVGFALAAGGCWAAYILLSQKVGGEHGAQAAAIGTAVGALVILPVGLFTAGPKLFDPALLPAAVLVGALSSAIPYTLEMIALMRMSTTTYGTLVSIEPAVAALIGLTVLGERLRPMQWAAIGAVVVASAGSTLTMRRMRLSVPD